MKRIYVKRKGFANKEDEAGCSPEICCDEVYTIAKFWIWILEGKYIYKKRNRKRFHVIVF
jgi:hypothetical protein